MDKLVWRIGCGKDDPWVKWVYTIYIKGANWWTYQISTGASWIFKHLCKVKEELMPIGIYTWSIDHKYFIKKVYEQFMGDMTQVNWAIGIWNRLSLPKHKFIAWLGILYRLRTKDKLFQYKVSPDNLCCLCGSAPETHNHLFFECEFSRQLLSRMLHWVGVQYRRKFFAVMELGEKSLSGDQDKKTSGAYCSCRSSVSYLEGEE